MLNIKFLSPLSSPRFFSPSPPSLPLSLSFVCSTYIGIIKATLAIIRTDHHRVAIQSKITSYNNSKNRNNVNKRERGLGICECAHNLPNITHTTIITITATTTPILLLQLRTCNETTIYKREWQHSLLPDTEQSHTVVKATSNHNVVILNKKVRNNEKNKWAAAVLITIVVYQRWREKREESERARGRKK